jgi:hypothetical protein
MILKVINSTEGNNVKVLPGNRLSQYVPIIFFSFVLLILYLVILSGSMIYFLPQRTQRVSQRTQRAFETDLQWNQNKHDYNETGENQ